MRPRIQGPRLPQLRGRDVQRLNPGARNGGKEILQVHPQDNALAHVRGDERLDGPPSQKPLRRGMRWNPGKNPRQDLPLQFLQPHLRRFNQSNTAGAFRPHLVTIVPQSRPISLVPESLEIGEPSQLAVIEQKPVCQRSGGLESQEHMNHFKVTFHSDDLVECGVKSDLWKLVEVTDRNGNAWTTTYRLTEKGTKIVTAISLKESGRGHEIPAEGSLSHRG